MGTPVPASPVPAQSSWFSNPLNWNWGKTTAPANGAPASVAANITASAAAPVAANPAPAAPAAPAQDPALLLAAKVKDASKKLSMTNVDKLYEDKVTNSGWVKYLSGIAILTYLWNRGDAVEADKVQGGDIKAYNASALALIQLLAHRNLSNNESENPVRFTSVKDRDQHDAVLKAESEALDKFYTTFRTRVNQIVPDKNNTGDVMIYVQGATETLKDILATVNTSNNAFAKKWLHFPTAAEIASHNAHVQTKMNTLKDQFGEKVFGGIVEDYAGQSLASITKESMKKTAEELVKAFPKNTTNEVGSQLIAALKGRKVELRELAAKLTAHGNINSDEVKAIAAVRKLELEAKHLELEGEFLRIRGNGPTPGEMHVSFAKFTAASVDYDKAEKALIEVCQKHGLVNLPNVQAMAKAPFNQADVLAAQATFNTTRAALKTARKEHLALRTRADELVKFAQPSYAPQDREKDWMGQPMTVAGPNNTMVPVAGLIADLNAQLDPTNLGNAAQTEARTRGQFYAQIANA